MRSPPDLDVAPGASPAGGASPSAEGTRTDVSGADDDVGRRCEVSLQSDCDPARTVISVVGLLEHSGGALLAAVLEYVREREGGPVAVDLRGVFHADRHGLAPLIESDVVLAGTSPAVAHVLAREGRSSADVVERPRRAGSGRLPRPGKPVSDWRLRYPAGGLRSTAYVSPRSDPTN
jgi:hypothetical protein